MPVETGTYAVQADIPVPDYDDDKELYAFFGLAVYSANLFEGSLINLAVVLQLRPLRLLSRDVFERIVQNVEKKTLGSLIVAARSATTVPDDVEGLLGEALEKRNYLIHRFYRAHAEDLLSETGRRGMIDELRDLIAFFKRVDPTIVGIYEPLWAKYGVDDEFVRREMQQMKERAQARDMAS